MPELPEVETFRHKFETIVLNKMIKEVKIKDSGVLDPKYGIDISSQLAGTTFIETKRHAKYLFARNNKQQWVFFHFGMTGDLHLYKKSTEISKHDHIQFYLENKEIFCFSSQRKFARIGIIPNIEAFIKEIKYGPDALAVSSDLFIEIMQKRSRGIKSGLLNQKLISGLGNLYSDEVLFRSGIHPGITTRDLSETQLRLIHSNMQEILQQAIEYDAYYGEFPEDFFINHRKDKDCPKCKKPLSHGVFGGRSTFFCQNCQPTT